MSLSHPSCKYSVPQQVGAMFLLDGELQAVDELIKEIGGGMNFKRKQFLHLMDRIAAGAQNHAYDTPLQLSDA